MIADKELIAEYDKYYSDNPDKWTKNARNKFMFQMVSDILQKPKTVLDVGCGNGHTLKYLYDKWGEDVELHGLDLSPVACSIAERKVPGVITHRNFLEHFKSEVRFDLILCMGVAEHFRIIQQGLGLIRDLLSENGAVYLEVPNCLEYSPGKQGYRRTKVGSHQLEWHLTRERWTALINNAGFEIVASIKGRKPAWQFVWVLK